MKGITKISFVIIGLLVVSGIVLFSNIVFAPTNNEALYINSNVSKNQPIWSNETGTNWNKFFVATAGGNEMLLLYNRSNVLLRVVSTQSKANLTAGSFLGAISNVTNAVPSTWLATNGSWISILNSSGDAVTGFNLTYNVSQLTNIFGFTTNVTNQPITDFWILNGNRLFHFNMSGSQLDSCDIPSMVNFPEEGVRTPTIRGIQINNTNTTNPIFWGWVTGNSGFSNASTNYWVTFNSKCVRNEYYLFNNTIRYTGAGWTFETYNTNTINGIMSANADGTNQYMIYQVNLTSPVIGNSTKPTDPTMYASGVNYTLRTDVNHAENITNYVIFEHNSSSTLTNVSSILSILQINATATRREYNLTNLGSGLYSWKWYANDSNSKNATVSSGTFNISENTTTFIRIILNNTLTNRYYNNNTAINITAVWNSTGSVPIWYVLLNVTNSNSGWIFNMSTTSAFNITNNTWIMALPNNSIINVSSFYNTTGYNTNYTVTRNDTYIFIDMTPPRNYGISVPGGTSVEYNGSSAQHHFNITVIDNITTDKNQSGVSTVLAELDGVNYSTTQGNTGNYGIVFVGLSSLGHTIKWFANDTALGSPNEALLITQSYTLTTSSAGGGGGGGGGGSTSPTPSVSYAIGDGKCERDKGENEKISQDCTIEKGKSITKLPQVASFYAFSIGISIAGIIYFQQRKKAIRLKRGGI